MQSLKFIFTILLLMSTKVFADGPGTELTLQESFIGFITNPTVAYLILLIGIYGVIFELAMPGMALPGILGVLAIIIALYAFHLMPVNYIGLGLLLLGLIFMVGEIFLPIVGLAGILGIIVFITGSILLFDANSGMSIPLYLIITVAVVNALFMFYIIKLAVESQKRKVVSGTQTMVGMQAEVIEDFTREGQVLINGEIWHAQADRPMTKGQKVTVTQVEDLMVTVH